MARSNSQPDIRLSDRAKAVESSGIRRVFDLGATMKSPINLSIGQPDLPVPEAVREAAKAAIDAGKNGYTPTQGIAPLRERIARKLAESNGVVVSADDVLVSSGSSGAIYLALASLLNPGDEVIIPDPYFVMYASVAEFFGAKPVFVDTYPGFDLDPDRVARAVTPRTRAIIINSPNNPTGAVYSKAALTALASVADRHGLVVLSDEVYEPFTYDGAVHFSIGSIYPRTLTMNAFSKSHSLTGWRVGYAAGPSVLIDKMKELQQYSFVCAPSFAQYAALTALDMGPTENRSIYERRRDLVYEGLRDRFEVTKPQGAFYIMPKVADEDAFEFVERLIEKNVLVIPGSVFSQRRTHIRLSFATSEETISRGVEIIRSLA